MSIEKTTTDKNEKSNERISAWSLIWHGIVAFGATGVSVFGIIELLDYFGISFFSIIESVSTSTLAFIVFIIIAMVAAVINICSYVASKYNKLRARSIETLSTSTTGEKIDDSILSMLVDAQANSRWSEIIKIGTALSDFLWYTGRKELRIKVGQFVENAARQSKEYEVLASTLIEDLGNTQASVGNYSDGITNIRKGIDIADQHSLYFQKSRGYRNLACVYCARDTLGDVDKAEKAFEQSLEAIPGILSQDKRLEAMGSTEYAHVKLLRLKRDYDGAITALNNAIDAYKKRSEEYPATKKHNQDRIVKMLREKGVIYLEKRDAESIDLAYECFQEGLHLAQETNNFDNIVVNCTNMAKILLDKGNFELADATMKIAERIIDKIDTPRIKNDYNIVVHQINQALKK